MNEYFVILNPASGGGRYRKAQKQLRAWFQNYMPNSVLRETEFPGHGMELATQAVEQGFATIISVGGDGTLHEVVNGMAQVSQPHDSKLAMVPLGTAGDFSKFLYEKYPAPKSLHWLKTPQEISVDLGVAHLKTEGHPLQKRFFINVGDVGLGGEVIRRTHGGGKPLGILAYLLSTLRAAWNYRAPHVEISGFISDSGSVLEKMDLLIFVAANGRYFGGGMCIAPQAEMDDGLFHLVAVSKKNPILR